MKRFWFLFAISLFVVGSLGSVAYGQATTGAITGTVADQSGASVAGAKVTALNPATNFSRETTSAGNGAYRMDALPVGLYTVTTEASGFKKSVINQVQLSVNDVLALDVKLEVGQVSETVTVTEAPSAVQTQTSVMGKVIDSKMVSELGLLAGAGGRNPLNLALAQTGVVAAGQVGPFSVNGQRAQSNNFMLDGGDSNDLAINVPDAVTGFSPDALQEFRILSSTYSADFGRNSGSIVNVISKSGTNDFHGNLYEYFRNRVLNATPFFNNTPATFNGLRKPQFNVNEFGGTIGGPVYLPRFGEGGKSVYSGKNRTFFFFSYEGFRRRQGVVSSASVPSLAQRNAVFNFPGTPQQIKNLLNQIPAANSGNNTLLSSVGNTLDRNQYFGRIDSKLTEKNNVFVSFFRENQKFTDPFAFGGSTIPGFGTSGVLSFTNWVVDDTHIFNTKSLNEVRFSFHRRDTLSVVPVNHTTPADLGISGIVFADPSPSAIGPPRIDLSGFSNWGNTIQGPQGRKDDTLQFVDNFSHTINAKHSAKFGGEYRTYVQHQTFDFINNGYYIFDGSVTNALLLPLVPGLNAALSDFARGLAVEFVQNSAGRPEYHTFSYNFYALDDWKVTNYLTLNLGVRYEYDEPLYDSKNRVLAFRPGQQSTVFPTAPRGIVYPGDAGITRSTYKPDRNNFAPRLGFAWDVLHNGKLSLRGGAGMFYDTVISETTLQFLTSPPFAIQPFVLFTQVDNPWSNSLVHNIPQPFPFGGASATFDFTNIAPIGLTVNEPKFQTPYSYQYNLNTQWEFRKGYTLEVGYVGSAGHHQLTRQEINPAIPGPGANGGNTDARRVFNQGNPQNAAFGGSVFSGITNQETSSNSVYNSLQGTISHRFSKGFYFANAYTWGHCIDASSGLRSNNNAFDMHRDRGNCDQDIRHREALSAIYELPWYKSQQGAMGRLLGGFEITGIFSAQTGLPFDITEGTDRSLTGAGDNRPDVVNGALVFLNPRNTDSTNGGNNRFFNGTGGGSATAATNPYFRRVGSGSTFTLGAGRFGSLGRNVFHGPGFWNLDLSIIKRTHITEKTNVEFRAEFFNIFNHAQFNNPNGAINSANFGLISSTRDPRLIQFAMKFNF